MGPTCFRRVIRHLNAHALPPKALAYIHIVYTSIILYVYIHTLHIPCSTSYMVYTIEVPDQVLQVPQMWPKPSQAPLTKPRTHKRLVGSSYCAHGTRRRGGPVSRQPLVPYGLPTATKGLDQPTLLWRRVYQDLLSL